MGYYHAPAPSCHPPHVFHSVAFGETWGTLKRHTDSIPNTGHLHFLRSKLVRRGYSTDLISSAFSRACLCWDRWRQRRRQPAGAHAPKKFFFESALLKICKYNVPSIYF